MGKLFGPAEKLNIKYSAEEFVSYYRTSNVVSLETITDFLGSVKDDMAKLGNFLTDHSTDRGFLDATEKRHETLSITKRLHFADIANEQVTIPEKFDGYYFAYVKDLVEAADSSMADTESLLNNLKMAIAGFINEHADDKGGLTVYGKIYADASSKLTADNLKKVSAYFPLTKSVFKAKVKDVLRNLGEVEGLYDSTKKLEAVISIDKITKLSKLAKEVSEMVDALIEQNTKSNVLLRNSEAKKDLVEMIHIGAKSVEFTSYLYSNTVYFYNALKSLSATIITVGKR